MLIFILLYAEALFFQLYLLEKKSIASGVFLILLIIPNFKCDELNKTSSEFEFKNP